MITFKIAVRNVVRHRTRSLITLSAIVVGCTAVIFVGGYFSDILLKMRESYIRAHTGHLQVYRAGYLEKGSAAPFDYLIEDPDPALELIRSVRGVRYATQRLQFSGLIGTQESSTACFAQGVEPAMEPSLRLQDIHSLRELSRHPLLGSAMVVKGESLDAADASGVLLGAGLAKGMGADVGDTLVLLTNTVAGSVNALDVTVRGVFQTSSKEFDDHSVRLGMATAQNLLQTRATQTLVVMLEETDDTPAVKDELTRRFREAKLPLEIRSWDQLSDFYTKTKTMFAMFYSVIDIVVVLIIILSIFNTMNMAVLERTNEIGTLMAMGTRRGGVMRLFLYEGLALGTAGGVLGVACGTLIVYVVALIGIPMPPPPGATTDWLSEPRVVRSALALGFGLSVVSSVLSSLYPAYKASRLEVAQALRYFS